MTLDVRESVGAQINCRTDHIVELHEERSPLIGEVRSEEDELVIPLTQRPKMIVLMKAPTKPSTVFFGERAMSCVRPKVLPQIYAQMSLQITRNAGIQNQIIPWSIMSEWMVILGNLN